MLKIISILLIFFLSGCSLSKPVEIRVPVALNCPVVSLPPQPDLLIYKLTVTDSPAVVVRAYVVSVRELLNWERIVRVQHGQ